MIFNLIPYVLSIHFLSRKALPTPLFPTAGRWWITRATGRSGDWRHVRSNAGSCAYRYYAYLNSDGFGSGNSQNSDLITPTLNLSSYSSVTLAFNHYFKSYSGSSGTLSYSINNGSTWTQITQFTTTSSSNPTAFSQSIPAVAGQSQVKFKWNYTGTFGYFWAFDDVSVTGIIPIRWLSHIQSERDCSSRKHIVHRHIQHHLDSLQQPDLVHRPASGSGNATLTEPTPRTLRFLHVLQASP